MSRCLLHWDALQLSQLLGNEKGVYISISFNIPVLHNLVNLEFWLLWFSPLFIYVVFVFRRRKRDEDGCLRIIHNFHITLGQSVGIYGEIWQLCESLFWQNEIACGAMGRHPRASNHRQCKDHFSITLSMSVARLLTLLKSTSFWGALRDHSRVSPAAVASAAVHVVRMGCPLFVRVPDE